MIFRKYIFFKSKKKFCDCCVAWLPSVRSSQCSSPGELDQRMKNVLWWLRIGSWVGTWWQEGQSSHHSPPDSCGQHRCQQRASLLVSQTRGWFRPTLFYRNIEEGCNYWEVGDSASLQDQRLCNHVMPTESTCDAAHGGPAGDVRSLKWQVQVWDPINAQESCTEITLF